jgi:hypothetical protein
MIVAALLSAIHVFGLPLSGERKRVENIREATREADRRIDRGEPEKQCRVEANRTARVPPPQLQEASGFGSRKRPAVPCRDTSIDLHDQLGLLRRRTRGRNAVGQYVVLPASVGWISQDPEANIPNDTNGLDCLRGKKRHMNIGRIEA